MDLADKELVAEFVIESQEGLADVENQMLEIESGGANIDTDLVNAVFRTMHSIKGSAGFLGLDRIGSLAHGLEEVLDNMRNLEVVPTSELVTTVLRAADFMTSLIDAVESSHEADVTPFIAALQQLRPGAIGSKPETEDPPPVVETQQEAAVAVVEVSLDQPSLAEPVELDETVHEFLIECIENLDQMDNDLLALEKDPQSEELLRNVFRTIHTVKGGAGFLALEGLEKLAHVAENVLSELRNGDRQWDAKVAAALLATVDKCRDGLQLVETRGTDEGFDTEAVVEQLLNLDAVVSSPEDCDREGATPKQRISTETKPTEAATAIIPPITPVANATLEKKDHVSAVESTIRVDVSLLDKLMTRVGELVLARNQILQHTNHQDDPAFVNTAQRLNLITTELQEDVMKTRMQPIGNVWSKFPRVVRDLSSQLEKQIRIEMEGKETDLDKTILEAIKDPLTHLVRNSVDHGIESPEVRTAAGKPAEGILSLRAFHEGGQVNIEISDDGAGLDLDRIRKKAIERGLINADQADDMSEREAAQLILLPGFSTAETVSSVSGRGVGMDVVKTNIEKIGGMIDVQSRTGKGTTVNIKIPLTLAIIPALVVTNGGNRYAIPQVSLLELVRLEGEQVEKSIEYIHGAPVYRLRGTLLPIVDLSDRLGLDRSSSDGTSDPAGQRDDENVVNIVVLSANDRQFGLIVDGVIDTEEIVVKPLSRQLKRVSEYAGATIMGDGTVALILDVVGLANSAGLDSNVHETGNSTNGGSDTGTNDQTETLLVVDLGDSRRFAMPTSMVARLEKLSRTAIEYGGGSEVIQYRGAIMPLIRLAKVFGIRQAEDEPSDEIQIVVYNDKSGCRGLVVNRILDIVETELNFQTTGNEDNNLLGTVVIQERVTDVLNMQHLARLDFRPEVSADRERG